MCAQKGDIEIIPRSIPSFVRSITFTKDAFLDGCKTSPEPWIVKTTEETKKLVSLLLSPERKHPVVIFSTPDHCNVAEETILPVQPFFRRTVGFAHTVIITSDVSYALTNYFGSGFSVFNQAIRTYNPGFDPDNDLWADHPLATAERIRGWEADGTDTFFDFLVQQTLRLTRSRDILEKEHPPFQKVKMMAAQHARKNAQASGEGDAELVTLLEQEIEAAKKKLLTVSISL